MTNPIPEEAKGLIPHLVVSDAAKALDFYTKAFGAEELCRMTIPGGSKVMHAEMKVGGYLVYLADDFPEMCGGKSRTPESLTGSPVSIHRYVKDVDAAVKQAEQAGATVTMPPADMFWGDRFGTVTDPFGHQWSFATHVKDMTPDEMEEAAKAAFA